MKKISIFALTCFFFFSCGGGAESTTENSNAIETQEAKPIEEPTETNTEKSTPETIAESSEDWVCIPGMRAGKITANTGIEELKRIFLAKNVVTEDLEIAGGLLKGTRIYPDTDNEALIFWQDETTMTNPARVVIQNENAEWVTNRGVKIGTPLEELEKMNGQAFKLYGFEWDYAGTITSWEGGELEESLKIGEKFTAQLGTDKAPGANYGDILGEDEFMSNLPAIQERELKVVSMGILLN